MSLNLEKQLLFVSLPWASAQLNNADTESVWLVSSHCCKNEPPIGLGKIKVSLTSCVIKANKAIHIVCVPMILMTSFLLVRGHGHSFLRQLLRTVLGHQYTLIGTPAKLARYTEPSAELGDYSYLDIRNGLYSDGTCGWRSSSTSSARSNCILRLLDHYVRCGSKLLGGGHLRLELGRSVHRSQCIRKKSTRTTG